MEEIIAARRRFLHKVEAQIGSRVAPRLGKSGVPFHLEIPQSGVRSLIFRLEFEDGSFYVVRFVSSWVEARRLVRASHLFQDKGVPVPQLVLASLSPLFFLTSGHGMLVEEGIRGSHLDSLGYEDSGMEAAGRALAKAHRVTRKSWGHLGFGSPGSYFRHVHNRTRRRIGDLVAQGAGLSDREGKEILQWLEEFEARFRFSEGYSLCHMRVNLHNLLVSEDGRGYLIDLARARYADPGIDLIRARHRWCVDMPEKVAMFDRAYFEELEGVDSGEIAPREPYHHAVFHLAQANRRAKHLEKARKGQGNYWQGREGLESELKGHLAELRELAGST